MNTAHSRGQALEEMPWWCACDGSQGTSIVLKISPHSSLGMPILVSSQSPPILVDTGTGIKKLKLGYVPGSLCTAKWSGTPGKKRTASSGMEF